MIFINIFQKGFNFDQDGPGNRLVYHLQGCNMHCIWCSNPEGMPKSGGKYYSVDEIYDEIMRSRLMFFSNGGVTFTGGEATMQADELLLLLKRLKTANIHTCIETNGTSTKLKDLSQYIDYLIMDFKHYDSNVLKKYTGIGNENIKSNFEYFCSTGRQLHIRIPLINGINADNPYGFCDYFKKYNTENVKFEFLSYHEYGKEKWTEEYKVTDGFVSAETVKQFKTVFTRNNFILITT